MVVFQRVFSILADFLADLVCNQPLEPRLTEPFLLGKYGQSKFEIPPYSHSIVPGGLLVTSYTTRLIPRTSLMMRVATRDRKAWSKG